MRPAPGTASCCPGTPAGAGRCQGRGCFVTRAALDAACGSSCLKVPKAQIPAVPLCHSLMGLGAAGLGNHLLGSPVQGHRVLTVSQGPESVTQSCQ